jgi:hypothetical protein
MVHERIISFRAYFFFSIANNTALVQLAMVLVLDTSKASPNVAFQE